MNLNKFMSVHKKWIITLSGAETLDDVVKKLAENGFVVDQILDEIGCIVGTADENKAQQLRAISGVADVSPDAAIDLEPPDSPVTW